MLTKVLHHMGEAVPDRQVQRRPPLTRGAGKGGERWRQHNNCEKLTVPSAKQGVTEHSHPLEAGPVPEQEHACLLALPQDGQVEQGHAVSVHRLHLSPCRCTAGNTDHSHI